MSLRSRMTATETVSAFTDKQIIVAMQIIINTGNSSMWSTVIFACYISAGMTSHVLFMKASVAYVSRLLKQDPDEPPFRTLAAVCAVGYICCIPFCTGSGVYFNYMMEGGIAKNVAVVIAWTEILGLTLFYGVPQIDADIAYMLDQKLHSYWIVSWAYSLPLLAVVVFVHHSFKLVGSTFHLDDYEYPSWAKRTIASLSLITILPVPVWIIRHVVRMDFDIKKCLRPGPEWGPSDPDILSDYQELRQGKQPCQRQFIDIVMAASQNELSARNSVLEVQSDKQDSKPVVVFGVGSSPPTPAALRKPSSLKLTSKIGTKKLGPTTTADGAAGPSGAWATARTGTPRPPSGGKDSADSGVYDLDEDIITEFSAPEKVLSVERNFKPPGKVDDLVVEGKQCPRRLNGKEREKKEEEEILDRLRGEGLVVRPGSKASGGMSFEVSPADNYRASHHLPPLHVKKSRKQKKETRAESIEEKLQKAEVRRKTLTDEKLKKVRALSGKARRTDSPSPKGGLETERTTHPAEGRKKISEEPEEKH